MKTCDTCIKLSYIWAKNRGSLAVTCKWNPESGEGTDKNPSAATRSRISPCTNEGNK